MDQKKASTCVVTQEKFLTTQKAQSLSLKGVQFLSAVYRSSHGFRIKDLLRQLGRMGVQSLLVEGGPGVWTSFIQGKYFQEICLFLAPKVLGGDAQSWLGPLGLERLPASLVSHTPLLEALGEDLLIRYRKIKKN
ncbi:MAG: dihydrofolate reductase family protein, partial [bacterium]|nr:dihydrofolate reductase family protein [bacterium]